MKKDIIAPGSKSALGLAAVVVLLLAGSANFAFAQPRPLPPDQIEAARTWGNTGANFNTGSNWVGGTAPGSNDVGLFTAPPAVQPAFNAPTTIAGLRFSDPSSGYNFTSNGAVLTLNGVSTTGSGGTSTASASAIRNDNTSGTITFSTAGLSINLAPSTGISTFFQEAGDGSTLIFDVAIGETGTVALSLKNGTFQLNRANTYSGGTSIDAAGTTVVLGDDSGLGTGTFTVNNTSTLQAVGPRAITNATILDGTLTIAGSSTMTFTGTVTVGPSSLSRTLTANSSDTTTLEGSVFLSGTAATGRTLVINGTGNVGIDGVVSNFNGAGTAGTLSHGGSGVLTLNSANTYSGGTLMSGGTTIANVDGALGAGNVSLTASGVTLTLQGGAINNYISDNATLSLATGSIVNLDFTGADTVNSFVINGVTQAPGVHNTVTDPLLLFGTGNLLVLIPEPSTWVMTIVGAGLLLSMQRFRRKQS